MSEMAATVDPFQIDVMPALRRAAQRAREIARQTNTPLVIVRDGMLVHEMADGRVVKMTPLRNESRLFLEHRRSVA